MNTDKWTSRVETGTSATAIYDAKTLVCIIPYKGTPESRAEYRKLIMAIPSLLSAAKEALRTLEICRDDLAAGGDGGAGDEYDVCEEAKALTPVIKQLRAGIAKAEG